MFFVLPYYELFKMLQSNHLYKCSSRSQAAGGVVSGPRSVGRGLRSARPVNAKRSQDRHARRPQSFYR